MPYREKLEARIAVVLPWVRQSIQRLRAGVVLLQYSCTCGKQTAERIKERILGVSMGLVGSGSAESDPVITCQLA